uniref:Uncharacterized protein n=1 Tax=Anguilla anguilla TaxID=7936 RepID=A0A0E9Q047_ANGAN
MGCGIICFPTMKLINTIKVLLLAICFFFVFIFNKKALFQ